MRFFKKLGILIYTAIMLGAGALFLLMSADVISPDDLSSFMEKVIYGPVTCRAVIGLMGGIFVLIGAVSPYRMGRKLRTDRVISFQNPDGEVSVSLSAIEEYIRKIAKTIPGIKDIKSRVDVGKRGIDITIAVSLGAGSNIPEVTERIQMEVRNRVQSMIGVEESVNIKMHITRIMGSGQAEAGMPEEMEESHIPFGREA